MFKAIRLNRSMMVVLVLVLCAAAVFGGMYFMQRQNAPADPCSNRVESYDKQTSCQKLLVNTYLPYIREVSHEFYAEYYTEKPETEYSTTTVKEIIPKKNFVKVIFTTKPYLGSHDTIGIDEITFSADQNGTIRLEGFDHIKTYELPENLKNLQLKPVPEAAAN